MTRVRRTIGRGPDARCGARASVRVMSSTCTRSASTAIAMRSCCSSNPSAASPATPGASAASIGASTTANGIPSSRCSRIRIPCMATSDPGDDVLARVAAIIEGRKAADPRDSYVAALMAKGDDAVLKKIGEEATETVMAAKYGDKIRITGEVADLWFHCLVLLARHG